MPSAAATFLAAAAPGPPCRGTPAAPALLPLALRLRPSSLILTALSAHAAHPHPTLVVVGRKLSLLPSSAAVAVAAVGPPPTPMTVAAAAGAAANAAGTARPQQAISTKVEMVARSVAAESRGLMAAIPLAVQGRSATASGATTTASVRLLSSLPPALAVL